MKGEGGVGVWKLYIKMSQCNDESSHSLTVIIDHPVYTYNVYIALLYKIWLTCLSSTLYSCRGNTKNYYVSKKIKIEYFSPATLEEYQVNNIRSKKNVQINKQEEQETS